MSAFQAEYKGSIPLSRTNRQTATAEAVAVCAVGSGGEEAKAGARVTPWVGAAGSRGLRFLRVEQNKNFVTRDRFPYPAPLWNPAGF